MRLHLDHLTLSVRSDGTWAGTASSEGNHCAVTVSLRAQKVIRDAIANMDRRALAQAQKRALRRTRREMGLCMSCPEKTAQWRCEACARKFKAWRAERKERKTA